MCSLPKFGIVNAYPNLKKQLLCKKRQGPVSEQLKELISKYGQEIFVTLFCLALKNISIII